jgi:hypothetical protein
MYHTLLQVSGDVFIGRYFDNEQDFKRMDFTSKELSSSAPWIKDARQQLMRRSQRSDNTQQLVQSLKDQQQQPAAAAATKPLSPSEVEKNKGNEVGKMEAECGVYGDRCAMLCFDTLLMLTSSNTSA